MTTKRKWIKRSIWTLTTIFVLMNVVAIFHSYKFTHFTGSKVKKTQAPQKLSALQKIKTLIFGVNNPRPENRSVPATDYETIKLKSNREIECWSIKTENSKGTVILFHGFSGEKYSMLDKAAVFRAQGFNVFLVDFMGSGGSEGNQTTIGFLEAEQVKSSFEYLSQKGEQKIYLFGTSMGSVAIMKAINDYQLSPQGIIIECPFGSMYQTVCARFKTMNAPTFPMAGLLVFWGGIQNGFWAFEHNPTDYAKKIKCPTLLLYGAKDEKVSKQEIDEIFKNLDGKKQLKIYQEAGHENYLTKYRSEWVQDIQRFLTTNNNDEIKNGDLIFQTSLSAQSKAIQLATKSKYSHCGLIYKNGNDFYVLEAIHPVKQTPLDKWIGRGQDGKYIIKRLKNADQVLTPATLTKMKQVGDSFNGKNYDLTFEWSDDKIYCSELIWKIYQRATGIEIGTLEKLSNFDLTNETVKKKMKERYGDKIPTEEIVISPAAIFNSELLTTVKAN